MAHNRRRRPTGGRRATFAAVALILGGTGLVAANVYASASESGSDGPWTTGAVTLDCPDVGNELTDVPDEARAEVDGELAQLDQQTAAAYRQLQDSADAVRQDSSFADNAVMNPLKEKRGATIERIAVALDRVGDRPQGLEDLAACTLRTAEDRNGQGGDSGQGDTGNGDQGGGDQGSGDGQQGNGGQAGNGPVAADYADITTAPAAAPLPAPGPDASRGTFTTSCGVNAEGLFNSDNVIVAPGVSNGAHHFHDYVGNQSNTAFASDDDLANAGTSCADQGDKSSYYWPVLRLQNGTRERDADAPGGGTEGNAGRIVTPKEVSLTFVGSPRGEVTAMPRLLRIITGDAKAFVNGTKNANASWSCTGFEDRQLKDKYPLCPGGSDVVRTFRFQSCWDGRNIDSANHRTHVAFAGSDGSCPEGFRAIPQLVQRIVYDVDAPSLDDGGRTTPLFAVDSFPEQLHKPVTDHGDFVNVFDERLMAQMVACINEGRTCGAGAGDGSGGTPDDGAGSGNAQGGSDQGGSQGGSDQGGSDQSGSGQGGDQGSGSGSGAGDGSDGAGSGQGTGAGDDAPASQPSPSTRAPRSGDQAGSEPTAADTRPRVVIKSTTRATTSPAPQAQDDSLNGEGVEAAATAAAAPVASAQGGSASAPRPQAVGGDLAETGTQLWPAAAGGVLVLAGVVLLLRRTGRRTF